MKVQLYLCKELGPYCVVFYSLYTMHYTLQVVFLITFLLLLLHFPPFIVLPLNSPRIAVLVVTLFVCLVSTFVSHTVAALILIPLVLKLGVSMGIPAEMVICCAFAGKYILVTCV